MTTFIYHQLSYYPFYLAFYYYGSFNSFFLFIFALIRRISCLLIIIKWLILLVINWIDFMHIYLASQWANYKFNHFWGKNILAPYKEKWSQAQSVSGLNFKWLNPPFILSALAIQTLRRSSPFTTGKKVHRRVSSGKAKEALKFKILSWTVSDSLTHQANTNRNKSTKTLSHCQWWLNSIRHKACYKNWEENILQEMMLMSFF